MIEKKSFFEKKNRTFFFLFQFTVSNVALLFVYLIEHGKVESHKPAKQMVPEKKIWLIFLVRVLSKKIMLSFKWLKINNVILL
jgi:hypothetical protein